VGRWGNEIAGSRFTNLGMPKINIYPFPPWLWFPLPMKIDSRVVETVSGLGKIHKAYLPSTSKPRREKAYGGR